MIEYELVWNIFHSILGFASWSYIIYVFGQLMQKPKKIYITKSYLNEYDYEEIKCVSFLPREQTELYCGTTFIDSMKIHNEKKILGSSFKKLIKTTIEDDYGNDGKLIISSIKIAKQLN